ncbi:hypothetical protein FPJ27_15650 [Burkholderia sp. MS455]|uniref:hypothetical protein n=1 Tax=Burkholderia sp. MS455 TaxID=2811788 RepID=UPI00195D1C48|nr:hypothetical protein [Burkholderia sp. MS455]QRR07693.1 hypothetical protein FPJ27_15650 [Burkholderia sp. MS455]
MQSNLSRLGTRVLRQLCMPGAHNAGMNVFHSGTAFASACNTVTQEMSVFAQLCAGARYFDIRPVISAGQYVAGHYTWVEGLHSWQGANGQSILSIIDDVNNFTIDQGELIFISLSHDLDTDVGNQNYSPFSQGQWNGLLALMLEELRDLFVVDLADSPDLTALPLNRYIGNGRSAVVVIVKPSGAGIEIDDAAYRGFYSSRAYPVYDSYANTNQLERMITDQLAKMRAQRASAEAPCFVLSWTLTQEGLQQVTCPLGLAPSLLEMASTANAALRTQLLPACTHELFPNILYVDGINMSLDLDGFAMQINSL